MTKKRQAWAYGPRIFAVVYMADTPYESIAKDNLDIRDAHRLCLSARELGLDASLIVSQRIFAIGSVVDPACPPAQAGLFDGEGAEIEPEEEGE